MLVLFYIVLAFIVLVGIAHVGCLFQVELLSHVLEHILNFVSIQLLFFLFGQLIPNLLDFLGHQVVEGAIVNQKGHFSPVGGFADVVSLSTERTEDLSSGLFSMFHCANFGLFWFLLWVSKILDTLSF